MHYKFLYQICHHIILYETIRIKTDAFSQIHFDQDKCLNSQSAEIILLVMTVAKT